MRASSFIRPSEREAEFDVHLKTEVTQVNYTFSGLFMTSGLTPGHMLEWLKDELVGRHILRFLVDGRSVIGIQLQDDTIKFKEKFDHYLDMIVLYRES